MSERLQLQSASVVTCTCRTSPISPPSAVSSTVAAVQSLRHRLIFHLVSVRTPSPFPMRSYFRIGAYPISGGWAPTLKGQTILSSLGWMHTTSLGCLRRARSPKSKLRFVNWLRRLTLTYLTLKIIHMMLPRISSELLLLMRCSPLFPQSSIGFNSCPMIEVYLGSLFILFVYIWVVRWIPLSLFLDRIWIPVGK